MVLTGLLCLSLNCCCCRRGLGEHKWSIISQLSVFLQCLTQLAHIDIDGVMQASRAKTDGILKESRGLD